MGYARDWQGSHRGDARVHSDIVKWGWDIHGTGRGPIEKDGPTGTAGGTRRPSGEDTTL